jgi:hypothetical protein
MKKIHTISKCKYGHFVRLIKVAFNRDIKLGMEITEANCEEDEKWAKELNLNNRAWCLYDEHCMTLKKINNN